MEEFITQVSSEEEALIKIVGPLLESEGFELVKLKLKRAQSKGQLLIYIDKLDDERGVLLKDLEYVSRLLSDVLDASLADGDILTSKYDLEVSSPGVDRPLAKKSHFINAVGERIKVKLVQANELGSKKIFGDLIEVNDDFFALQPESLKEDVCRVNFHNVADANIVFDFTKLDKKPKKSKDLG